jgi:hypothetical protein
LTLLAHREASISGPAVERIAAASKGPKLMHESDPGIALSVAHEALSDPQHSDQKHSNLPTIEDGANPFEAGHPEA